MRVAFHFDPERFRGVYGFRITELFFRELRRSIPPKDLNLFVRRGDLLVWELARDADSLSALAGRLLRCTRPIWATLTQPALAAAMARQPWVLAVEGIEPERVIDVDRRLQDTEGYLGAMEVYLANPVHWVLYDRKLVAAYRLFEDDLRLLAISEALDPEARHESRIQEWARTGVFRHVEWEDIGLRDTVFDDLSGPERAKRVAEIEDSLDSTLGPVVGVVLMRIASLNPTLFDSLHAALQAFNRAESDEQLAQASLSCRRFVAQLADILYPARQEQLKGRKVGPQEYRNRLWAYIEENAGDERSDMHSTLEGLGKRLDVLDERAQKHVHGPHVDRADVNRLILGLTVWTYDLLTLTPPPKTTSLAPHRAALDEFVKALIGQRRQDIH